MSHTSQDHAQIWKRLRPGGREATGRSPTSHPPDTTSPTVGSALLDRAIEFIRAGYPDAAPRHGHIAALALLPPAKG